MALEETLASVVTNFDKPVLLVETAYPWTLGWFDNVNNIIGLPEHVLPGFEATPEGQYDFLKELIDIVKRVPGSNGLGIVYWAPEYISVPGVGSPWENMALFDENGAALIGLEAFKEEVQAVHTEKGLDTGRTGKQVLFYPTPFRRDLNLKIETRTPQPLTITFYTLLGEEVESVSRHLPSGQHTIQLTVHHLPTGLYVYKGFLGSDPVSGTLVKVD